MRFKLGCRLRYRSAGGIPFVFNIAAQSSAVQRVEEERLSFAPDLAVEHWTMPESGNRYCRVVSPAGEMTLDYTATVDLLPSLERPSSVMEIPIAELPLSVMTHLYPSRYCQSDRLERFARATFDGLAPGYNRVNGICNWIHDYVDYEGGVSDALTSAYDTVTLRAGVCRDFAHLGIALCRVLGIPARYVSAYAFRLEPPDFHAVFEAFLRGPAGPGWYVFDPTRLADPAGLVRIGIGRDAAEVAFCSPYGDMSAEKPEVWITAIQDAPGTTTAAVRTGDAA